MMHTITMSDQTTQDPQEDVTQDAPQEPTPTQPASDDTVSEVVVEPETATETTEVQEETPEEVVESTDTTTPEPAYKAKLTNFSELKPGQTVRVHERIIDISPKGEERQRVQVFEGIILGLRGSGLSRTLTVRKVSGGVGVEKIYPINSPVIAKIELVKTARVRKAKLTFLTSFKKRFKRKFKETYVS